MPSCGGHNDSIKRRGFLETVIAIALPHRNIGVPEPAQPVRRAFGQRWDTFYRVYLAYQPREHGGLIAGTRPNFEHDTVWPGSENVGHQRNDERLGDGLTVPDREWMIRIARLSN